jgi:hypothetical protein
MSAGRQYTSFDRSPAADLWRHTLSPIPSTFGRLVFLSTLRDPNSGAYRHYGLAQHFSEEEADDVLRDSHRRVFAEWNAYTMEEQRADLDLYLAEIEADRKTIVETWARLQPYRNLIPAGASDPDRLLYTSNLELHMGLLMNVHGVDPPDRDA